MQRRPRVYSSGVHPGRAVYGAPGGNPVRCERFHGFRSVHADRGHRCLAEGSNTSSQELSEFLAKRVAKWWLPERWTFIDEVPKTSVGKFDKKVLRSKHEKNEFEIAQIS